jgi:putative ABC transport system ATP-binding protein
MFLISAIAAAVLAVGATGLALATGARRRQVELAGMRATGVDRVSLWRALWGEQALTFAAGVLLGTLAGLVGAAVALRSIPEFVDAGPGPPLQLGLPPADVAATVGVLLVALVLLTGVGSRVVSRGAVPERIGTEQVGTRGRHPHHRARRARASLPPPRTRRPDGASSEPRVVPVPGGVPVKLSGVLHLYGQLGDEVVGLRGVDLEIAAGEMVALVGPSGMGKTTLVRLMAGLMTPSAGTIRVGERELSGMRPPERRRLRGVEVGYVAQGTGANVLPFATAVENVWFAQNGARSRGHRPPWDPIDLLGALGLDGVADERLATLPHGPQQLVAVATGVATGPRLLLADEPTAQLSEASAADVVTLFRRINEDFGTTVVIVTHDEEIAASFPRTVTIRDGRVGSDALEGQQYAVVDGSGSVQLPPDALLRLPPSTRVRVVTTPVGVELRSPELERAVEEAELEQLQEGDEHRDGGAER